MFISTIVFLQISLQPWLKKIRAQSQDCPGQLFLLTLCNVTGTFRCTFCQTEVEEDESVCPDARTLVARFNEQIEPIYALLRETEDVNLSHDLLEPEPAEIPALKQRSVSHKPHRNTLLCPLSGHRVTKAVTTDCVRDNN